LNLTISPDATSVFFVLSVSSNPVPANLVWIHPGTYLMGSQLYDTNRYDDEVPQRLVTIQQGFWLCKYEVSQEEYTSLIPYNPSQFREDPKWPVESLTWQWAMNYCAKVTEREARAGRLPPGYVYRLPTEAEWEYACRAGTTTIYSFGDDPARLGDYAWYIQNSGGHPHPGGQRLPNPWGLYDMHGNVFEWCIDEYGPYPGGLTKTIREAHVNRGGSFYCPPRVVRSACRSHYLETDNSSSLVGFRVALAPRLPEPGEPPPPVIVQPIGD
jgi:formylglycine-generating enzyme required for sulfatase activity